jgi:TonB family protein
MRRFGFLFSCLAGAALLTAGCGSDQLSNSVRQDINAQLTKQRRSMASCLKKAVKRNKRLRRASVTLAFTVDEAGSFNNVRVSQSSTRDARLQQCVMTRAQGLKVAQAPEKPVNVSYPLHFKVKVKRLKQ